MNKYYTPSCPKHPEQLIIFTSKDLKQQESLYCYECISKEKIEYYETINKLFKQADDLFNSIKFNSKFDQNLVDDCLKACQQKESVLDKMKDHISRENQRIDMFYDDLLSKLAKTLEKYRIESKEKLLSEINLMNAYYDRFYEKQLIYFKSQGEISSPSFKTYFEKSSETQTLDQFSFLVEASKLDISEYGLVSSSKDPTELIQKIMTNYLSIINKFSERHPCLKLGKSLTVESLTEKIEEVFSRKLKVVSLSVEESLQTIERKNDLFSSICSDLDFVISFIGIEKKYKLLYKMTRDGFLAQNFHSKCDNLGPTITIIKSSTGNVFGGYADVSWDRTNNWRVSQNSFLFSVNGKQIYKLINPGRKTILCTHGYGPTFGGGHDLFLSTNFVSDQNYVCLGNDYQKNDVGRYYPNDGNKNFSCEEVEIFLVEDQFQVAHSYLQILQIKTRCNLIQQSRSLKS